MINPKVTEELQKQLEAAYSEISRLEEECAKARELDVHYDQGYEMGSKLVAMKKGMVDAGLSEEAAMQIILTGINGVCRNELW